MDREAEAKVQPLFFKFLAVQQRICMVLTDYASLCALSGVPRLWACGASDEVKPARERRCRCWAHGPM